MIKIISAAFGIAFVLAAACSPQVEPNTGHTSQVPSLSACHILYDSETQTWVRAILPQNSTQFELCDPLIDDYNVEYEAQCQLINYGTVLGYETEPQRFELLEEYCLDEPIDGRCDTFNCQDVHKAINPDAGWAYPSGCVAILNRNEGTCTAMWNDQ